MASRRIIVVGASAGGVDALRQLVSGLPPGFPASLFVVLHILPWRPSELPQILSHSGPLPALHPSPAQKIEPGRIYVAPPDRHLLIDDGHVNLWRGPKENLHRPAINPLFRSAAVAHKDEVIGVVMSGQLDDGSTGLWWVKRYGGVTVIQDPNEAAYPDMPHHAQSYVDVDFVAVASEMGPLLTNLVNGARRKTNSNRLTASNRMKGRRNGNEAKYRSHLSGVSRADV